MEYRNPFLSESILCHYVDLPNTNYVTNSFVNKYGYHDPKKEAQLRFDNAQSGSGMTFGGAKVKTAILLFIFSVSYTFSWFASQAKAFDYHWSILPATLVAALFFVLWMVNRPEHSSFLSPSASLLFGVFLGGIFHFLSPGFGESLFYALGIPICVLLTMMFVVTKGMCDEKHRLKTMAVGSLFSTSLLYFYVILAEYVFRIPMHFPLAMDSAFILILAICLIGAIYCVRTDIEVLDLSITYGAPRDIEWYYAFSIFATTAWFYIAGLIYLVQVAFERD